MSSSPSQAHEQLEEVKLEAVQDNNVELVTEILGDISSLKVKDDSAAELSRILKEPHFQVRRSKHSHAHTVKGTTAMISRCNCPASGLNLNSVWEVMFKCQLALF